MQAALPYVDDFLPVHNLASLEQLADVLPTVLSGLADRRRPSPTTWGLPSAPQASR